MIRSEALKRLRHAALDEDQIGDRHPVVGIDVARERGQRPVGHPNGHRRHVLERVGHRQKQNVHRRDPPTDELCSPIARATVSR